MEGLFFHQKHLEIQKKQNYNFKNQSSKETTKICFFLIMTFFVFGCGENHKYNSNDLNGVWEGKANNDSNSIPLSLLVDAEGEVKGSGFTSKWIIDQTGQVTGSGSYLFFDGSKYQMVFPEWSLKMNFKEASLSGSISFSYILEPMKVELKRKSNPTKD